MKKVEVTIDISASPSRVIDAFIDPLLLSQWWCVERTLIVPKSGGLYTLVWNITETGMGYVSSGIIREYDPGSRLEIGNFVYLNPERPFLGPMNLSIEVEDLGSYSKVTICQDGYQSGPDWDWYYEAVRSAWPLVAENLKNFLEKKEMDTIN